MDYQMSTYPTGHGPQSYDDLVRTFDLTVEKIRNSAKNQKVTLNTLLTSDWRAVDYKRHLQELARSAGEETVGYIQYFQDFTQKYDPTNSSKKTNKFSPRRPVYPTEVDDTFRRSGYFNIPATKLTEMQDSLNQALKMLDEEESTWGILSLKLELKPPKMTNESFVSLRTAVLKAMIKTIPKETRTMLRRYRENESSVPPKKGKKGKLPEKREGGLSDFGQDEDLSEDEGRLSEENSDDDDDACAEGDFSGGPSLPRSFNCTKEIIPQYLTLFNDLAEEFENLGKDEVEFHQQGMSFLAEARIKARERLSILMLSQY